jgi:hypothetical protein
MHGRTHVRCGADKAWVNREDADMFMAMIAGSAVHVPAFTAALSLIASIFAVAHAMDLAGYAPASEVTVDSWGCDRGSR